MADGLDLKERRNCGEKRLYFNDIIHKWLLE